MQFSNFGNKFMRSSGILQLMDDLGDALTSDMPVNMLGGGNPARIEAVNQAFLQTFQKLAEGGQDSPVIDSLGNYSNPQGDGKFIQALVDFFNRHYDWQLTMDNIALTNGSQNAFFYLFNLFGGQFDGLNKSSETNNNGMDVHDKAILLPLAPEYIGYDDVHIAGKHFVAIKPLIEEVCHEDKAGFFKYQVNFEVLENLPALHNGDIGAICCSRPTNPTGNVLTDDEMKRLSAIAKTHDIPLIIDNAYGMPFPNIIHADATLNWDDNTILCFSLSKVGLPGVRTGIVVSCPKVITAISAMNAIVNLAPTRFGAAIATPLVTSDVIKTLSDTYIQPFYVEQVREAVSLLQKEMADIIDELGLDDSPLRIHRPEGAIFLWLWFKGLPISSTELYQRLKKQGTLIIPGEHFFVGVDTKDYPHAHECIRMSIAQDQATLQAGIKSIAKVIKELYQ